MAEHISDERAEFLRCAEICLAKHKRMSPKKIQMLRAWVEHPCDASKNMTRQDWNALHKFLDEINSICVDPQKPNGIAA